MDTLQTIGTDFALNLLMLIAPVIAGLLAAILIRYLKSWGLVLSAEHEAMLQAKTLQLVLAIEEEARRNKTVVMAAGTRLGGGGASLKDPDPARTAGVLRERTVQLAGTDQALAKLGPEEVLRRADAALTSIRLGLR